MKTKKHVSQMGADIAIQFMLSTLFRLVADLTNDPDRILAEMRAALLELAASGPLPKLPAGAEKEARDAARIVISGVLTNAGALKTH